MNDEQILTAFREDALPPSEVDVSRAVRIGRRHGRVRALAAGAGAVAVLAAGAIAVPTVLAHSAGRNTSDPATGVGAPYCNGAPLPAIQPTTPPDATPTEFNPLRYWLHFGDTGALTVQSYTTARFWQQATLTDRSGQTTVDVVVQARGGQPVFADESGGAPHAVDPTTGTPTDEVGGHPAFWLPGHQALHQYQVARLGWQWGSNAWVFVAATDTSSGTGTPLPALARSIADGLRVLDAGPVPVPFSVKVPGCTRLALTTHYRATRDDGTPYEQFDLTFGDVTDDTDNPLLSPASMTPMITVSVSDARPGDKPGSVDSTFDGHAATRTSAGMIVYGAADGRAIDVSAPGWTTEQVDSLVRAVHPRPVVDWTENPLE